MELAIRNHSQSAKENVESVPPEDDLIPALCAEFFRPSRVRNARHGDAVMLAPTRRRGTKDT